MKCSLLALFLITFLTVIGQKPPIKYGDIDMADMKMKFYDKDTSASALVLADYGSSSITYTEQKGFSIVFERIRRVKIFKKDGFEFATMEIPLYHSDQDEEKLLGLKAATYTLENGKIVTTKMKSDQVFREQTVDNLTTMKLTLPNIKEGCIIEISYSINSDFLFNFQDWEFQETIPVKWSEYRAVIPEYFTYNNYTQGYITFNVNENTRSTTTLNLLSKSTNHGVNQMSTVENDQISYEVTNFRWAVANAPAFKEEPQMNNYRDYISKINFELAYTRFPNSPVKQYTGTWEGFNKQFLSSENFGVAIKGSGFLTKLVDQATIGATDPKEKMNKIYSYIRNLITWNGDYRKYTLGFRKVIDDKKGNSADINLLLVSMLQKADLDADPVLLSTRNHGFIRKQSPLSTQFNYVICKVNIGDRYYLLDATDISIPGDLLPKRCLNGDGYVVSEKNSGWVPLKTNAKSKTSVFADLIFTEEGKLEGKVTFSHIGYNAQDMRKSYYSKGEESYIKNLAAENRWEIRKSVFENLEKLSEPPKEVYELSISDHVQDGGQSYFFNPLFDKRIDENPFKATARVYPVDFGNAHEETFTVKITVPEKFLIDEVPKSKILVLPETAAKFVYNSSVVGNTIVITSGLSINRSLFAQTEYDGLREFYAQVVAKQEEQVVLKKK